MKFKININIGLKIPFGYGISKFCYEKQQTECYPFGIHIIVAMFYRIWYFLAYKLYSRYIPLDRCYKLCKDAYEEGIRHYTEKCNPEELIKLGEKLKRANKKVSLL
jgi:hypothetical protein